MAKNEGKSGTDLKLPITETGAGDQVSYKKDLPDLSPDTEERLKKLKISLREGEAKLVQDENNHFKISYKDDESKKIFFNPGNLGKVVTPKDGNKDKVLEQILSFAKYLKKNVPPSGMVLHPDKVQPGKDGKYIHSKDFEIYQEHILGSGLHGEVVMVYDKSTGEKAAYKKVMLLDFREEEIRAWQELDDCPGLPQLYCFNLKLVDNKAEIFMEPIEDNITLAKLMEDNLEKFYAQGPGAIHNLSVYAMQGMLETVNHMHKKGWSHGDMHGGQVLLQNLEDSMKVRIVDLGRAERVSSPPSPGSKAKITDDLWNVLRIFIGLYSGRTFQTVPEMKAEWRDCLKYVPEQNRREFEDWVSYAMEAALNFDFDLPGQELLHELTIRMGSKHEASEFIEMCKGLLFNEGFQDMHENAKPNLKKDNQILTKSEKMEMLRKYCEEQGWNWQEIMAKEKAEIQSQITPGGPAPPQAPPPPPPLPKSSNELEEVCDGLSNISCDSEVITKGSDEEDGFDTVDGDADVIEKMFAKLESKISGQKKEKSHVVTKMKRGILKLSEALSKS